MRPIEKLLDLPVVTVQEGRRLGTLAGVEINPAEARIVYLRLHLDGHRGPAFIPWSAVQSVGLDVVLIQSEAALLHEVPASLRDQLTPHVGDRPVLTENGDNLGKVTSYDVDEATGSIQGYRIGGFLAQLRSHTAAFPPSAIRTFGRDAIIVGNAVGAGLGHPEEEPGREGFDASFHPVGAAPGAERSPSG